MDPHGLFLRGGFADLADAGVARVRRARGYLTGAKAELLAITGLRGRQLFHFHRGHVEEVGLVAARALGGRETWIADRRTAGVAGRRPPTCGHSPQVHVELLGLGWNMIRFGPDERAIEEPTNVVRKPLHPVGMPARERARRYSDR